MFYVLKMLPNFTYVLKKCVLICLIWTYRKRSVDVFFSVQDEDVADVIKTFFKRLKCEDIADVIKRFLNV